MSVEVKKCAMCDQDFPAAELDFLGRCDECFKKYMTMPEAERPRLGTPYSPIYNGKDKYGF